MKHCLFAVFAFLASVAVSAATLVVDQSGKEPGAFRTINEAAEKAGAGDTVLVYPGVYREHVAPVRGGTETAPLVFRAAKPGEVFVKGSDVWKPVLTPVAGADHCFTAPLPADDPAGLFPNPYKRKLDAGGKDKGEPARPAEGVLLPYTLGQIFCNGLELRQSQTVEQVKLVPGSWIVTPDGSAILIRFPQNTDPAKALLEITLRDRVFAPARRGLGYIHLEGFIFEHCANQAPFPQLGMVSTRSGNHWEIRNNVIRHAKTVGLDIGSEYWTGAKIPRTTPEDQQLMRKGGWNLVEGNRLVDNGLCGVAGWSCTESVIRKNIVERNNFLSLSTHECGWEEWGGIKLHEAKGALIADNLVRFNGAHGIWIDNGFDQARITRNVLFGNTGMGIFIELGFGRVVIDNNIVANTTPFAGHYPGYGIYAHDASGVKIYHNLVMNNAADAVLMKTVTDRKAQRKLVETSDEEVRNNLFYNNQGGVCFPYPSANSQNCVTDNNLFIGPVEFRYSSNVDWKAVQEKADKTLDADGATRIRLTHRFLPEAWPAVSGWEAGSKFLKEGQFEIRIKPFEPSLYLYNRTGGNILVPAIPGLDRDFDGLPYGKEVLPGPFQSTETRTIYRILFPLWQGLIDTNQ